MNFRKIFLPIGLILCMMALSCSEKESDLGVNLQDPSTVYSGVRDTVSLSAWTVYDDSLSAAGYASAVFGNFLNFDPSFGKVRAVVYSQISAPKEGVRITDEVVFDSVVMTLVIDTVCPIMADSTSRDLHVIVNQLANALKGDSAYLASDSLPESSVCFFDGMVTYYADSIRLRLNENVYPVLRQTCSQADFVEIAKGFSLKLDPRDNPNTMLSVNFTATSTRLMLYYHTATASNLKFEFTINGGAAHSMYYQHDYSGTPLARFANNKKDSLSGTEKLYLEPLGGTRVRLNMNAFVSEFKTAHPNAVVHYAELILPVADDADTSAPVRILALKCLANGSETYVTDANVLTNAYTYGGFDGYYNREKKQYRLRMTRHLQELLREGVDYGTELVIDARRSSAFRTIINGTNAARPIMIDFVYSE